MDDNPFFYLLFASPCGPCVLILVAFVVLTVIATRWEKKKIEKLFTFAVQNGFEFTPGLRDSSSGFFASMAGGVHATWAFLAEYEGFNPIYQKSATVKFIFDGKAGELPYRAFHYQYSSGTGKNRRTHYYMVASCELPVWLPDLAVSPEGMFDKLGKFFGGQDIQFESHEFNEMFRIVSSDEKVAHDVLHPQMMEWFMHVQPPGFQAHGRKVVLWRSGQLTTDFVLDARAMMAQYWDLVPDYVKQEWSGRG